MVLPMVGNLHHIVTESVKVDLPGCWSPSKMIVALCSVPRIHPLSVAVGAPFCHHSLDQRTVVAAEYLKL